MAASWQNASGLSGQSGTHFKHLLLVLWKDGLMSEFLAFGIDTILMYQKCKEICETIRAIEDDAE